MHQSKIFAVPCFLMGLFALFMPDARGQSGTPLAADSVAAYPSIQAAIDANPGKMLYVPAGDYPVDKKIVIHKDNSGLFGPGRIIQRNAEQPIVEIERVSGVQLRDLTLTRAEEKFDTNNEGILAIKCRDLVIDNIRVIDNRTRSGAITLRESQNTRVSHCLVRNYMRVTTDDRTQSPAWGYAFRCTDGTGISVSYCTGTLIEGNRIIEENLVPTPELKAQHKLGDFVKKNPQKGTLISQETWDAGYTNNWQQGSALIVTAPEVSDLTRILGNHIENAAQGIDLHSDHVIVANNIVTNSFVGMKAMHGSRNVIITGNQFSRNDLWAIGMMPGAAAHPAAEDKPETDNSDGGSIIANNIISDFGRGHAQWIWGTRNAPLKFDTGQEADDPPLADVLIQGNIVHAIGAPRYKYAVVVPNGKNAPRGLRFSNNLFHAGTQGVANIELPQ